MGLCDLYTNWKNSGYEKPVIEEMIEPDRITLTLQIEVVADNRRSKGTDQTNQTTNQTTDRTNQTADQPDEVSVEEEILFLIKHNPRITQVQIADELNIPKSTVKYYVSKLSKAKIIKREGTVHNGKWIVL